MNIVDCRTQSHKVNCINVDYTIYFVETRKCIAKPTMKAAQCPAGTDEARI